MIGIIKGTGWEYDYLPSAKRVHFYETGAMSMVTEPVEELYQKGVTDLILTAAVGALNPRLKVGEIYHLSDTMTLFTPRVLLGKKFVDMSKPFEQEGGLTHVFMPGPHFETYADKQALRALGADVVGMSITPEVIYAKSKGMRVWGLVLVTNGAFEEHSHEQNLQVAKRAKQRAKLAELERLIHASYSDSNESR